MSMRKLTLTTLMTLLVIGVSAAGCSGEGEAKNEEVASGEAKAHTPVFFEIMPGLTAIDSVMGQGAEVQADDYVIVHYAGYLYEDGVKGNKFDASYDRGEPISFPLGRSFVITGWERGLTGMHIGSKRSLIISPELAYGAQGRPPVIPANATLFFDIEMVDIGTVTVTSLEAGDGPISETGDQIEVHYTGWLWEDGKKGAEFDSSSGRGVPYKFTLGAGMVIPGWDQGLTGMSVGTKARLIIPAVMGYGKRGSPPKIPADATLCFDVELVSIAGK
ncbi:MAG: peptidylprolyl isomerase [Candidatus Krumholzibacteriia bacterium]|jgi:peptidylprolyl isomerase